MKNILIVLAVLIIGGIGYVVFVQKPATEAPADTASQGKLDMNAVCEGALAYITFPDGASADAFVAECKEGKRPEVIERYKAEMNLGAGAEI